MRAEPNGVKDWGGSRGFSGGGTSSRGAPHSVAQGKWLVGVVEEGRARRVGQSARGLGGMGTSQPQPCARGGPDQAVPCD